MGELLSMLRFNAGSGHIWLNEHRMMLLHTRALAGLRRELFDSLGVARARGLLVRMGFASGLLIGPEGPVMRCNGIAKLPNANDKRFAQAEGAAAFKRSFPNT